MQPGGSALVGYELSLLRLDTEEDGAAVLSALANRYEVSALDGDGLRFRVVVDGAFDPDEAVVRLASVLDEIDRGWEARFDWPKATGPVIRSSDDGDGKSSS